MLVCIWPEPIPRFVIGGQRRASLCDLRKEVGFVAANVGQNTRLRYEKLQSLRSMYEESPEI